MERLNFAKMSGAGNDFVIFDNRHHQIPQERHEFVRRVCLRRLGVGADGVLFVEPSDRADFRMAYYNADGGEVEMCGNGGRCISRYAYINGIAGAEMSFETIAGLHHAKIVGDNVKLGMIDPQDARLQFEIPMNGERITGNFINTGVPHVVVFVSDVEMIDVVHLGSHIRYHSRFAPAGTNANFAQIIDQHTLKIRTYERGVEDETLACGTGTVASAVTGALLGWLASPVEAHTRSRLDLTVYFQLDGQRIYDVYLEGDARLVFEGTLLDPWMLEAL